MNLRHDGPRTALLGLVVAISLGVRVLIRGRYYPGWDVIFATQGTFVAATMSWRDAFAHAFDPMAWGIQSVSMQSILCVLLPGYLGWLWPWEYWAHFVTFVLVVGTLALIAAAMQLPPRRYWVVLLAWSASPALLSHSVAGFPWATAFLPYAIALLAILHPRLRRTWVIGPLLCVAAVATAWHVYDLGKTVFVVFLAGALLVRDVPIPARLLWLATGGIQLYAVLTHPSGPAVRFMGTGIPGVWPVIRATGVTIASLFASNGVDLPFLLAAAFVALLAFRRDRLFLATLLVAQLGLIVLVVTAFPDDLRPRRFLLVGYCALALVAAAFRDESRSRAHSAIVVLLVAGSIGQLVHLIAFARGPRPAVDYPLPYTYSQVDYMVPRPPIDWAARIGDDVLAGKRVVVVYGPFAYDENAANPTGVLQRVYLRVGHERFVRSVLVFASTSCEIQCMPLRPLSEIDGAIARMAADAQLRAPTMRLYYSQDLHLTFEHRFESESALVFEAVRRRFALRAQRAIDPKVSSFDLVPRPIDAADGITITEPTGAVTRGSSGPGESAVVAWHGLPFERYWVLDEPREPRSAYVETRPWGADPLRVRLRGTLHLARAGRYELMVGADESAELLLDGNPVVAKHGTGFAIAQVSLALTAGPHTLEARALDEAGVAHLLVDAYRETD
jgi:hypothetical protein